MDNMNMNNSICENQSFKVYLPENSPVLLQSVNQVYLMQTEDAESAAAGYMNVNMVADLMQRKAWSLDVKPIAEAILYMVKSKLAKSLDVVNMEL
ncbi:unnamed protein product [Vicia faba]|uniref:Uncharacterized protein n=1 Tax=Vicia faba TaxID=3906 RepID=A0AAV1ASZ6_VICFA|nr:unnamed protein product [Vicia faba]